MKLHILRADKEALKPYRKRNMRDGVRTGRHGTGVNGSGKVSAACKKGKCDKCYMLTCEHSCHKH